MTPRIETTPLPATPLDALPAAVAHLRETFATGRTRPIEWRRHQLSRLAKLVDEHAGELLHALHADLGKPEIEARVTDLAIVRHEALAARRQLARWMRPEKVPTPLNVQPATSRVVREPLGVVLIIAPWNYPVQLLLLPLVGAIAAGNCAVLKPSEVSGRTSAELARLVPQYLDRDAVAIVEGGVEETTALLRERFDHVFYTGNGSVARVVMEAAAKHLTPVTLELGGKSPCIVDRDANVELAARRIAWGKFINAGQTCIAPDYVLVHESREGALLDALKRTIRSFYGDDPKRSPDYARIVNERHHRRLAVLLKDGETVIGGEADESERYIAPTVLRRVAPDAAVMAEEIFGPILPVLPVRDVHEAIRFVNERPKPLALYVFTSDAGTERAVIEHTSSGGVCVNGTIWQVASPALPFGGVGPSGMGAYHGRHSFELFSHRKSVLSKSTRIDPALGYPPYTRFKTRLMKRLL